MQHRAKKHFGQNFLVDHNIVNKIVAAVDPQRTDNIVEIGPGLGALTHRVLPHVQKLHAIEIDNDVIATLVETCKEFGELDLIQADALHYDFSQLATRENRLRVIGNLPYNVASQIIFHLLETPDLITDMHFMLQKEVVDRITAAPGSHDYGRLTIMLNYFCVSEELFTVSPNCFHPRPKVMSAIVRLTPHQQPPFIANEFEQFSHIVRDAFNARRKTIRNSLKNWISHQQLEQLGIDLDLRPERLSLETYVKISNYLSAHR